MSALDAQSSDPQGSNQPHGDDEMNAFLSTTALNDQYLSGDTASLAFAHGSQNLLDSHSPTPPHLAPTYLDQAYMGDHNTYQSQARGHLDYPTTSDAQPTTSSFYQGQTANHMQVAGNDFMPSGFDQDLFQVDAQFGPMLSLQESSGSAMFSHPSEKYMQTRPNFSGQSTHQQEHPQAPRAGGQSFQQVATNPGAQLLSPCLTTSSSPASRDDGLTASVSSQGRNPGSSWPQKLARVGSDPAQMQTPTSNQQHSPAFTGSSIGDSYAGGPAAPSSLVSPIVRVENYSREESPIRSSGRPSPGQPGSTYLQSGTHLSPYTLESSEDDHTDWSEISHHDIPRIMRQEDGAWHPDGTSGQAGLSPDDRGALKDIYVPTLKEQEESRLIAERNAGVDQWLDTSEVGSNPGGLSPIPKSLNRRRAKSTNDMYRPNTANIGFGFDAQPSYVNGLIVPGPGLYIDEKSELDEDEDTEDAFSMPESPPADVAIASGDNDVSYFPALPGTEDLSGLTSHSKPWNDPPATDAEGEPSQDARYQPPTSNAAMMRFRQRARDVESASLAATLGSRRLSESDIGSLFAAGGISKPVPLETEKSRPKDKRERSGSFLDHILPKRNNSNLLKRKNSQAAPQNPAPDATAKEVPKIITGPKRIGSWGRPKSPRADTNLSVASKDSGSSIPGANQTGPWAQAKNVIRRSRSRSDLGKKRGLAELMTQHGGPPMLTLASPANDSANTLPSQAIPSAAHNYDDGADDDLASQDPIFMDLQIKLEPIIPDYNGFKAHAQRLNPRLPDYMLERVTQEQVRRYKRLQEMKIKHLANVRKKQCPSNNSAHKFCFSLGGDAKHHRPRQGNKDSAEAPFMGFIVISPGAPDDELKSTSEGTVVAAQFPPGVPLPPVKRLPAEFECPLCFKVKKFFKPSDWTKHVHEDVQPFTCTFANCSEPKSFKRKADWVRHENERHRQLENWNCSFEGCSHVCYRKDNFVQHLVREHKMPEPRVRPTKAMGDTGPHGDSAWTPSHNEEIWKLVEECRRDTEKRPQDEPCRFCGNICNSWKKLTVHLAKHMEQISMPILPLIEQRNLSADTVISPVDFSQSSTQADYSSTDAFSLAPSNHPQFNTANNPSLGMGLDASMQFYSADMTPTSTTSQLGTTYPPPQLSYGTNELSASSISNSYGTHSYPGLSRPPKNSVNQLKGQNVDPTQLSDSFQYAAQTRLSPSVVPSSGYGETPMYSSPVDTSSFDDQLAAGYMAQPGQDPAGGYGAAHENQYHQLPPYLQEQDRQGQDFRGFG
jgi:hypothetical protein